MPTSSIFANFGIKDKKTAEKFVDVLEQPANDPERTLTKLTRFTFPTRTKF